MKKIITLALVLILSVCLLAGCGEGDSSPASSDKPVVTQEPAATTDSKDATEQLKQLKELEQKNIKLVAVYNEVAVLAVKNGWESDELIVRELNAADAAIKTFNSMIQDPASTEGVDMPEILSATDDLITELDTNTRAKVSAPFAGK